MALIRTNGAKGGYNIDFATSLTCTEGGFANATVGNKYLVYAGGNNTWDNATIIESGTAASGYYFILQATNATIITHGSPLAAGGPAYHITN